MNSTWLTSEVVDSVCKYMNEKQPDSLSEILELHGKLPKQPCQMIDINSKFFTLKLSNGELVEIKFKNEVENRNMIREELIHLAMFA
ncbi:MAG: hypothetical protein RL129_161 [Actinomycetota bacterium]|jgi:hypothetical protein